jgi:hypothetical protein
MVTNKNKKTQAVAIPASALPTANMLMHRAFPKIRLAQICIDNKMVDFRIRLEQRERMMLKTAVFRWWLNEI